jgi:hypothetical protein
VTFLLETFMAVDYPNQDFGFSTRAREELVEALLDGGPLHSQIIRIDAIGERELEGGYYQRDPACTYAPPAGGRYALFRWREK